MRQWANPHQLCVLETLVNEIKDLPTNKAKIHHTTVTLFATEKKLQCHIRSKMGCSRLMKILDGVSSSIMRGRFALIPVR